MDARTRAAERSFTERTRRPPARGTRPAVVVAYGGDGFIDATPDAPPTELIIEAIGPDGEPAPWFDDQWWTSVLERWMESALTVVITGGTRAAVHPVVLYHVAMIRRVAPAWRVIAHASADDLSGVDDAAQLVLSGYHEVHVCDSHRAGPYAEARPLEEIFADVRREQQRLKTNRPILVRVPTGARGGQGAEAVEPREGITKRRE